MKKKPDLIENLAIAVILLIVLAIAIPACVGIQDSNCDEYEERCDD